MLQEYKNKAMKFFYGPKCLNLLNFLGNIMNTIFIVLKN